WADAGWPARVSDVPPCDRAGRPAHPQSPRRSLVMNNEPLIAPSQTEIRVVEAPDKAVTQEQPSEQQQQTADEVFSREQQQAVAALLALQVGAGLLHNCALELSKLDDETPRPRPKKRAEGEENP